MAIPYEFLVRGKDNGSYSGAHVIDVAGGKARPVKAGDWPALLGVLNDSLIARVDVAEARVVEIEASLATLQAEMDAYKLQGVTAANAVLNSADKKTADAIARDVLKNKHERDKAAALAKLAEAQAEAAKFN